MKFLLRSVAGVAVLAVLALAAYGGWALLMDDAPSSTASTESVSRASSEPAPGSEAQDSWQEEMVEVCTRHMAEMQPVMEQMMRDMMSNMMDGRGDGGMMDGEMKGDGMMGR